MSSSKRLFLNIDINSVTTPFLNSVAELESPTKEDLYPFVDIYADTQITDVLFNNFCQFSLTPSKVFSSSSDIYLRTVENGIPVDHKDRHKGIHKLLTEYGLDAYGIWIDRCRQVGLKPWMTVRMNDCHCPDEETCFLRSDFFYEAKEKGYNIGSKYGYYRYCFDYSYPEVRQKMLDYMKEQLDRYDVDGLELDFQREIYSFDYLENPNCAPIMTDFIREVKRIVTAAEKKWGHKIEISTRLMRDIDQNIVFGYDARAWAKECLVDSITPTPRWETCDSDMPLKKWKEELPTIDIYAGHEAGTLNVFTGHETSVTLGYAANYLSDGVDGINLYNHFRDPRVSPKERQTEDDIFNVCASLDTISKYPLRHILTYQDVFPIGGERFKPLPIELCGNTKELSIKTSVLSAEKSLTLVLGLSEGDINDLSVSIDSVALPEFEVAEGRFYIKNPAVRFFKAKLPINNGWVYRNFLLSTPEGKKVTVYYAEIQAE